jgi:hypothetical protein
MSHGTRPIQDLRAGSGTSPSLRQARTSRTATPPAQGSEAATWNQSARNATGTGSVAMGCPASGQVAVSPSATPTSPVFTSLSAFPFAARDPQQGGEAEVGGHDRLQGDGVETGDRHAGFVGGLEDDPGDGRGGDGAEADGDEPGQELARAGAEGQEQARAEREGEPGVSGGSVGVEQALHERVGLGDEGFGAGRLGLVPDGEGEGAGDGVPVVGDDAVADVVGALLVGLDADDEGRRVVGLDDPGVDSVTIGSHDSGGRVHRGDWLVELDDDLVRRGVEDVAGGGFGPSGEGVGECRGGPEHAERGRCE